MYTEGATVDDSNMKSEENSQVIEEHGGDMFLQREVVSILFHGGKPAGVKLDDGRELFAPDIIYSGTVWNLYDKLIDPKYSTEKRRKWAKRQAPTYPSVVLYAISNRISDSIFFGNLVMRNGTCLYDSAIIDSVKEFMRNNRRNM